MRCELWPWALLSTLPEWLAAELVEADGSNRGSKSASVSHSKGEGQHGEPYQDSLVKQRCEGGRE